MISIGDRLRLNACGPVLFAEEHGRETQVKCSWMDPMGQWHVAEFASADLRKLDLDVEADTGAAVHPSGSRWSHMLTRVSSLVALW